MTLLLILWRSIRANTARLVLSLLAVVLGTSFVAGGFILTASLQKAFDDIICADFEGVDAYVSVTMEAPLTRTEVLSRIEDLPEVARVATVDSQPAALLIDDTPVQSGGAGTWVRPFIPPEGRVSGASEEITEGSEPTEAFHAILNNTTAKEYDVEVGDTVVLVERTGRHEFVIDGLFDLGYDVGGWAGLTIPADQYWDSFSMGDISRAYAVAASSGTSPEQLVSALDEAIPELDVKTGEQANTDMSEDLNKQLSFISYILLAFGVIALLVGMFIIANTFSMIIAQRTKDFALLRALGMSQPQLTVSVVVEAFIVGVVGSILGIGVGVGLVALIVWALQQTSLGIPAAGIGLDWQSILVPLVVGVVVTVWGAWAPARRAGAVKPVEAMRSGDQSSAQPLGARVAIGSLLLLLGIVGTVLSVVVQERDTSTRGILLGVGALALVVGWLLVSAWVVRVVGGLVPREGSAVVTLGGTNLARNPRRTASTAFALMMGVTLVVSVGILGASMKESIFGAIDDYMRADAVVSTGMITNQEFPVDAIDDLEQLDFVEGTMTSTWAPISINGKGASTDMVNQVTPVVERDPAIALNLITTGGEITRLLDEPGVGMRTSTARDMGVQVGDLVDVTSPMHPEPVQVPLVATWDDDGVYTSMAVSAPTARELVPNEEVWTRQQTWVTFKDGTNTAEGLDKVKEAVEPYAVLQVMDRYEFRNQGAAQVNGLLAFVYALLALSVIIAILGIINTLALSITERRREFGMLRAVGMQRGQIRRMITLESTIIALFGALAGTGFGVWLGYAFVQLLADEGLDRTLIPWSQLALVLAGAVVVGIVASLIPGRQAARTHPLAATG